MRQDIVIRFERDQELALVNHEPMDSQTARAWLDAEFTRLECVPARASGKVLIADKLLAIAGEVGPKGFADAAWASQFAKAAAGALGKAYVSVDVDAAVVGF